MIPPVMREPRVKICGLTRNEDARVAESLGADFLGVVLTPGFGRSVALRDATTVVEGTSVPRVAVLVDESPDDAARAARSLGASVLQLHGHEDRDTVRALRDRGSWIIWKAVRARTLADLRRAVDELSDDVDAFLVEGWRDGVIGGAGARLALEPHDVRRAVPDHVGFVLAGGLEPASVGDAVARFRPHVVDVSSGVEHELGRKDRTLVEAFIRAARRAPTTD